MPADRSDQCKAVWLELECSGKAEERSSRIPQTTLRIPQRQKEIQDTSKLRAEKATGERASTDHKGADGSWTARGSAPSAS